MSDHRAALHPSRTGELAVQTVRGQSQSRPPLATGLSHINPHFSLFPLENAPAAEVLEGCIGRAPGRALRFAQPRASIAPHHHCHHVASGCGSSFPGIWFRVRDFRFSPGRPEGFPPVPPGKFLYTHRHLPSVPGRDPAWAPPPGRRGSRSGEEPALWGAGRTSRARRKTQKRCRSASPLSHRCALAGGGCAAPAAAAGAGDPPRGAAEVGVCRAGGHPP